MKRVLVTGGNGQLGTELRRHAWPAGYEAVAVDIGDFDLADSAAVERHLGEGNYACVINGAAYTAVDKAESEVTKAWAVNAVAPATLARATAIAGIPIVHVSTDYVFDGTKDGRYEERDPVGPLNVYGASKEGGEQAVRTANRRHVIVRTSWVVSAHGANFVKTMLRLGAERKLLKIVDDQFGAPTAAADLAATLADIAVRLMEDQNSPVGTYHFSNAGETTWCRFASEIFRNAKAHGGPAPDVEPIATADYPTPARRPRNSRLNLDAIARDYGVVPRPWQAALADIQTELGR